MYYKNEKVAYKAAINNNKAIMDVVDARITNGKCKAIYNVFVLLCHRVLEIAVCQHERRVSTHL